MGGIFIILATIFSTALFIDFSNSYIIIISMIMFSFAIIGLVDDLIKVLFKNTNGFRGCYKIVIQFIIIGIAILWLGYLNIIHLDNKIFIPLIDYHVTLWTVLYIIFINFVIVGTSNAVNLTDGLDGLVSVPAIINLFCLIILIYCVSTPEIADYLQITHIKFTGEIIFLCLSLIGAIFGFLILNLKPAKIFMGDVGSLAIGSTLGLIAIIIKQEIIFFIISLVFVAESLSVIIQVSSYKIRKKRIFLMAPLHHHFEKLGWHETKVVKAFWASSFFFACLGMIIFLI
ncbi:phospho-N-acetylmuramoyl-pentapeptide-transferase [Alphaproteobacteria bacterium]|nr:phospho-N-acetylmuramoyl-pentapeptide-transferase [Alphaproteobacteria bacterium]